MAKKTNKKDEKKEAEQVQETPAENALPQNILPVGDRVDEHKNIYISQKVYKEIHKFTKFKTSNERGGILVGNVIEEFGKSNIIIEGFIEAKYSEGTPTTLTFTHETWEYVHGEIDKKFSGKKIVGWIHTHPDYGIFLSEYDKFIHQNFFSEENQIAYVIDPIQGIEGFYFWLNESIEKSKGFFIYDKTGVKITVGAEASEPVEETEESLFSLRNLLLGTLWAAVLFLIFSQISLNKQLDRLEEQQQALVASANQSLSYMQQQVAIQASEITRLNELLTEHGITTATEAPETTAATEAPTQETAAPTETTAAPTESAETTAATEPTAE